MTGSRTSDKESSEAATYADVVLIKGGGQTAGRASSDCEASTLESPRLRQLCEPVYTVLNICNSTAGEIGAETCPPSLKLKKSLFVQFSKTSRKPI